LAHVQLSFLRGVHHDRNHRSVGIALDGVNGLKAVHPGHQVIEEDHVGARVLQVFERFFCGLRRVYLHLVTFQDAAEDDASRARIINDEGTLGVHCCAISVGGPDRHEFD
jgi:hypothetical protein